MSDAFTLLEGYAPVADAFDEMFDEHGQVRPHYRAALEELGRLSDREVLDRAEYVGSTYLEQGITFDVGDATASWRPTMSWSRQSSSDGVRTPTRSTPGRWPREPRRAPRCSKH